MAQASWPDGNPRTVDDNEYEILGSAWSCDGILGVPTDTPVIYAEGVARQVSIRSGKYAHILGRGWSSGPTDTVLTIAANTSGNPRIDLVVLSFDRVTQLATAFVRAGTPAVFPSRPGLNRAAVGSGTGKWEIALAEVRVANNAPSIAATDVTPVAPYIGTQPLLVPDYTTLTKVGNPTSGMTALIAGVMYVYSPTTNWRRVDWNTSWGVIGGQMYSNNGGPLAAGIPVYQEYYLNQSSGPVTVVTGRRYQVRAKIHHDHNTNGGVGVFYIKENSTTGTQRAQYLTAAMIAGYGYERWIFGEWSETAGSTRTFVLTGYNANGLMNVGRSGPGDLSCIEVVDQGPSGSLSGPV